jgi:hypothetical protein
MSFGNLEISLGLDGIAGTQELWRFLTLEKAHDLFRTGTLYLRQVARLRLMDERESRLPTVIRQRMALVNRGSPQVRQFIDNLLDLAENQADRVYASCWYLPDASENYEHMWRDFGGGNEGGVCVVTTVQRLGKALPYDPLSVGLIRYVDPEMTFAEAFELAQYRSFPFLLKLKKHRLEREVRLFKRHHWLHQPECLRERVDLWDLIMNMKLSPLVSEARNLEISSWFISHGFPKDLFLAPEGTV